MTLLDDLVAATRNQDTKPAFARRNETRELQRQIDLLGAAALEARVAALEAQLAGAGSVDARLDSAEAQLAGAGVVDTRLDTNESSIATLLAKGSPTWRETDLYVLAGIVGSTGAIWDGTGYTVTKGAAGIYQLVFTGNPFSTARGLQVALTATTGFCHAVNWGNNIIDIQTRNSAHALADATFQFVAIGRKA